MAHLYAVWGAPTLDAAAAADRFCNSYATAFPAAVACFQANREALLAIHRLPVRHRLRIGTTNLAERSFEEERWRTTVIPRLMSEQATMTLAFATVIRAAEAWCRVSVNDIERHQLALLRVELGLDPPPATGHDTRRKRRAEGDVPETPGALPSGGGIGRPIPTAAFGRNPTPRDRLSRR